MDKLRGKSFDMVIIDEYTEVPNQNVLIGALRDVTGALSSINSGKRHAIEVGGEQVYWQREEWIRWVLDEVLPNAYTVINAYEEKNR